MSGSGSAAEKQKLLNTSQARNEGIVFPGGIMVHARSKMPFGLEFLNKNAAAFQNAFLEVLEAEFKLQGVGDNPHAETFWVYDVLGFGLCGPYYHASVSRIDFNRTEHYLGLKSWCCLGFGY